MDPTREIGDAMRVAREAKKRLVRSQGVGSDLAHLLELRRDGVALVALTPTMDDRDKWLAEITQALALSDADTALFLMECYGTRREDISSYGDLSRAFASGDPEVYESVSVHAQDRSGRTVLTQHPYRYEGRNVVWGEPVVLDSADDDAIVEDEIPKRMRKGFEAQATRPGRPLSGVELAYVLDLDALSFELKAPPRNGLCPCGSGLKSKHCCWR